MDAKAISELLNALAALAWPALGLFLIWRILPFAGALLKREKVTIKIGEIELSAEEAAASLSQQVKDIQAKIVQMERRCNAESDNEDSLPSAVSSVSHSEKMRRILWVDDDPKSNAIEIDFLRTRGYEVDLARSTAEALARTSSAYGIDLIITDMGREEEGIYVQDAGLIFVRQLRLDGNSVPVIIFTSSRASEKFASEARTAGVAAITSSPIDLYSYIEQLLSKQQG